MHKYAPQINFLPWRAERKKELTKELLSAMVLTALITVLITIVVNFGISRLIETQVSRNNYLDAQIGLLDEDLKEIKSLKSQRANMIERMRIIQGLQGNRSVIVHVFDEVVRILPDGTYFNELNVSADQVAVKGFADNNNEVSELMRNIDASVWMSSPNLTAIKAEPKLGEFASSFDLRFKLEFGEEPQNEIKGKR